MSIFDKIDGLLKILDVPFYEAVAEFPENEEPPLYVVYNLYDTAELFGDGELKTKKYTVTINIIGDVAKSVDELQSELTELFIQYDCVYAGCQYQIDEDYPKKYRRIIDFYVYGA